MKMLTGKPQPVNPILDESFKEEIIRAQNSPQVVEPKPARDGGTEINITSEIISEWLPKVMTRFNVCRCDRCSAELTVMAFDEIRPVVVRVKCDADMKKAKKLKAEQLQPVLMQLIRLVVAKRDMLRHDIKG